MCLLCFGCEQVVDCRICGDPNSVLRFAFIEFTDEGITIRLLVNSFEEPVHYSGPVRKRVLSFSLLRGCDDCSEFIGDYVGILSCEGSAIQNSYRTG